jgi:VPDSG-CTERM motif
MNKAILCLITAILGGVVSAFALPLDINLTSAGWSSANGTTQYTSGNITAFAAYPPGSILTWSSSAGIGIDAPGFLALSPVDILNLSFTNGSGNGLTGALVTNLPSGSLDLGVLELVTTTGTGIIDFSGQNSSGNVYINFGSALNVLTAEFCALDPTGQLFSQGYSVAGFTRVPDGGTTVALLGMGLISLMIFRRRFAF